MCLRLSNHLKYPSSGEAVNTDMTVHQAHSIPHRAFKKLLAGFQRIGNMLPRDVYIKMAVEVIETLERVIEIDTGKGKIKFHCDSEIARIRAMGAPEVANPIRSHGSDGFSARAGHSTRYRVERRRLHALCRGHQGGQMSIACDPLPQNHRALSQNALINGVTDQVSPLYARR